MAEEVGSAFVRLIPSMRGFGREVQQQLRGELAGIGDTVTDTMRAELSDAGRDAGRNIATDLERATDGVGTDIGQEIEQELRRELSDAGRDIGQDVAQDIERGADAPMDQAGRGAAGTFGQAFKGGLAGLGLAAGALLAKGFNDYLQQDRITARLDAQLGATPEQAQRYGRIAGQLYADAITADFQGAADAIRGVMANGLLPTGATDAQLKTIATGVADVADAFQFDLGETATAVGQLMRNNMAGDATEALDAIAKGLDGTDTRAGDLLETVTEYSTQFQLAGIDAATAFGLIRQGMEAGIHNTDKIGDTVKEFTLRAVTGTEAVNDAFANLGLSGEEMGAAVAAGGESARGALRDVLDALREMPKSTERATAIQELFGGPGEDLGAGIFALDVDKATQALGDMEGAAGDLGDALRDNAATRVEAFKRSMQQGLVNFIGDQVFPGLSGLKAEVSAAFADAGIDKASLASGIRAWWSGGKGELGGAVGEMKSMFTTATQAVRDIWNDWGGEITAALREHWSSLVQIIRGAFQILKGVFEVFAGLLTGDWSRMWEGVKNIGKGAWNVIVGLVRNSWNILHRILKTGFTIAKNLVASAWGFVTEKTGAAWRWVKDKIAEMMRRGYEAVRDRARGIRDRVVAIKDWVVGAFKGAGTWLLSAGLNIVRGLWNGIKSMGGWLKSQVTAWAKSVIPDPIEGFLGIDSPSKLMRDEIGRHVASGLALGIRDGLPGIRDAAGMAADAAVPGLPAHAAMTPAGAGAAAAPQLVMRPDGTQMSRLLVQMVQLAVDTQLGGDATRLGRPGRGR
ncbi:phage tail tape measure protein [Streptomyces sp. YIM 98790]|uniref:phage tail tape measure protein n=1 Tax=Streptomyces sp. YIM 98790 TaxID=2689077 RepID=UPI00140BB26E|nr:phage tail tape measure protein [Streptomyces sp. YIM 98790]